MRRAPLLLALLWQGVAALGDDLPPTEGVEEGTIVHHNGQAYIARAATPGKATTASAGSKEDQERGPQLPQSKEERGLPDGVCEFARDCKRGDTCEDLSDGHTIRGGQQCKAGSSCRCLAGVPCGREVPFAEMFDHVRRRLSLTFHCPFHRLSLTFHCPFHRLSLAFHRLFTAFP